MKGTEKFAQVIADYLNNEAEHDETIKAKLQLEKNSIENVVTYIINQVKNSGCCGFEDSEIFGMALHYVVEDNVEPGEKIQCGIVINRQVELTEDEIAEAKQKAIEKLQREQMEKLRKPIAPKKVQVQQPAQQTSLFDF